MSGLQRSYIGIVIGWSKDEESNFDTDLERNANGNVDDGAKRLTMSKIAEAHMW
jgi:hypothetical protein